MTNKSTIVSAAEFNADDKFTQDRSKCKPEHIIGPGPLRRLREEGYGIVPILPTGKMCRAGKESYGRFLADPDNRGVGSGIRRASITWQAMIAAWDPTQ